MHPADTVFAIGGEDESEPEEDLLAEGARRLGALAAGVSPTVGASQSKYETTSAKVTEAAAPVGAPPASPARVSEPAASPVLGVLPSPQRSKLFLESDHCGAGDSSSGTPSYCSTGTGQARQCATERARNSIRTSAAHRSSTLDDNPLAYRPEVDGPPIVG